MPKNYYRILSYMCSFYFMLTTATLLEANYHGTITTLHSHEYTIDNILIGGKQECIQVYKAPDDINRIITTLSYDPKEYISHLKLADIKEILIPYPYAQWVYKGKGKKKYLLIEVIWQHKNRPKSTFLIEPKRHLSGIIAQKRKTQRKIPLSGLKKICINPIQK